MALVVQEKNSGKIPFRHVEKKKTNLFGQMLSPIPFHICQAVFGCGGGSGGSGGGRKGTGKDGRRTGES